MSQMLKTMAGPGSAVPITSAVKNYNQIKLSYPGASLCRKISQNTANCRHLVPSRWIADYTAAPV